MCVLVSICSVSRGEGYTVITLYVCSCVHLLCLEAILSPLKLLQPDSGNWCISMSQRVMQNGWIVIANAKVTVRVQ